jgi:ribosomal protein S18 acetylase RimI-like enzyme
VADTEEFALREISPDDSVSGLSLGAPEFTPLKTFLRRYAKKFHAANAAKTYVFASSTGKVVGYITLVCSQIEIDPPDGLDDYPHKDFPAVKIARLAIDRHCRGNDLGEQLVQLAVAISTKSVMPHVGCRFLAVDSKQESLRFYEKQGFRILDTETNRSRDHPLMFMDLTKLL